MGKAYRQEGPVNGRDVAMWSQKTNVHSAMKLLPRWRGQNAQLQLVDTIFSYDGNRFGRRLLE